MQKLFFLPFLLLSIGCASKSSMKKIDPYIFLHDNSSKVWLVNKMLINKHDYTPVRMPFKEVIIFHSTRNCYFNKLKDMEFPGKKATYWLDISKREFGFEGGKEAWTFDIQFLSRDRLVLRPKMRSYPFTLELIPFPEY